MPRSTKSAGKPATPKASTKSSTARTTRTKVTAEQTVSDDFETQDVINDVSVLDDLAPTNVESSPDTGETSDLAARFGYSLGDLDGDIDLDDLAPTSEYAIDEPPADLPAVSDEPTDFGSSAKHQKPTVRKQQPAGLAAVKRAVKSKGTEKEDYLYELKRGREAVWYRLKKAGFTIGKPSKKVEGFRLDSDSTVGEIRVTHFVADVDKLSEADYAAAQERIASMVDRYEDYLEETGFHTHHGSIDGKPAVIMTLADNPVNKADAPWNGGSVPVDATPES